MRHNIVRHSEVAVWQNQVTGNDVIVKKEDTSSGTKHIYISSWMSYQKTLNKRGYAGRPISMIIFGTDHITSGEGNYSYLNALNPDGTLKWKTQLPGRGNNVISRNNILYTASNYYRASGDDYYLALDADNGAVLWQTLTEDGCCNAIGIDGSLLVLRDIWYVDSLDVKLLALSEDGATKWAFYFSTDVGGGFYYEGIWIDYLSPVVGLDGTIYAFGTITYKEAEDSDYYDEPVLYALTSDGVFKWRIILHTDSEYGGITEFCAPAIDAEGTLYALAVTYNAIWGWDKGRVFAVNPDGSLKWRYNLDSWVYCNVTLYDGVLYFGDSNGDLYALNTTDGSLKWKYSTGAEIDHVALSPDGILYFGNHDGNLYALNIDGTLKWTYHADETDIFWVVLSNDTLYFCTDQIFYGYIYAVTLDGTLKWKYRTEQNQRPMWHPAILL